MELEAPVADILGSLGLSLYDLEFTGGTLQVTVQREGGVDVDTLAAASRALSQWLDESDPIDSRYTLEVSSPGLERRLRTPRHFASAVGEVITLRERRDDAPTRRLEGPLREATETTVTIEDAEVGLVSVALAQIERARTVFHWGPTPRPTSTGSSKKGT